MNFLKLKVRVFDKHLKTRDYLVGKTLTVADVVCVFKFVEPYQTVLDGGFRKSVPDF